MIGLIIYCAFSVLFMIGIQDEKNIILRIFLIVLSPIVLPIILGAILKRFISKP